MDAYYEKAKQAYFRIFERAGLKKKTFLTFASGGSFSKYSHEFQTVTLAGEDIIYICDKCDLAVNKEIKDETEKCPGCGGADFREEKSIEVGNIFKLMNKFTKPFDFSVNDEKGEKREVIMGCYGIGLGRLMGTVVEVHHDDKGMVWPEEIAPFRVHLVEVKSKDEKVKKEAEAIYDQLIENGIEVLYDDREIGAGQKFADADLIGCPFRVVVSEKTLAENSVEIKKRNEDKAELVKVKDVIKNLK
ncbi:MAG: His/Gly/Thr/Pro-type tRNA ligase C-terminal domain-containing protein [Patescibacteria group bacterium]